MHLSAIHSESFIQALLCLASFFRDSSHLSLTIQAAADVIAASEPLSEIRAMQRQMLSPIPQRQKPPFHERFRLLGYLRGRTRAALFRFLRKLADTDDATTIQVSSLRNLLPSRPNVSDLDLSGVPYPGLGLPSPTSNVSQRDDVLFITARFRSGSTLLWNLF